MGCTASAVGRLCVPPCPRWSPRRSRVTQPLFLSSARGLPAQWGASASPLAPAGRRGGAASPVVLEGGTARRLGRWVAPRAPWGASASPLAPAGRRGGAASPVVLEGGTARRLGRWVAPRAPWGASASPLAPA